MVLSDIPNPQTNPRICFSEYQAEFLKEKYSIDGKINPLFICDTTGNLQPLFIKEISEIANNTEESSSVTFYVVIVDV